LLLLLLLLLLRTSDGSSHVLYVYHSTTISYSTSFPLSRCLDLLLLLLLPVLRCRLLDNGLSSPDMCVAVHRLLMGQKRPWNYVCAEINSQ